MVFSEKVNAGPVNTPGTKQEGNGCTEKNQFHCRNVGELLYAYIQNGIKAGGSQHKTLPLCPLQHRAKMGIEIRLPCFFSIQASLI
jgi:hypothetical protein